VGRTCKYDRDENARSFGEETSSKAVTRKIKGLKYNITINTVVRDCDNEMWLELVYDHVQWRIFVSAVPTYCTSLLTLFLWKVQQNVANISTFQNMQINKQ
jgi:hypothetical protein